MHTHPPSLFSLLDGRSQEKSMFRSFGQGRTAAAQGQGHTAAAQGQGHTAADRFHVSETNVARGGHDFNARSHGSCEDCSYRRHLRNAHAAI